MNAPHIAFDILIALGLIAPGIIHGQSLRKRGVSLRGAVKLRTVRLLVILFTVFFFSNVLILSIRNYPPLSWYLPLLVEYYATPALWMLNVAIMVFAFSALSTLAIMSKPSLGWMLPLLCVGVLLLTEHRFRTSPLATAPELSIHRETADGVILQTSGATCGAAACANVARLLGVTITEREMATLLGTTEAGTSPGQIIRAMQKLGFRCTKAKAADNDIMRLNPPAILFVNIGDEIDNHVVTLAQVTDDQAEVWDPSSGKKLLSSNEFAPRWGGRAIEFSK
ncbi:MAG: cysteine peptidase family C39 domain-containing protein [Candidatus Hydrogenedentes bacterium]|nr:cysteine peptidase family C39 domain-containing protein [Candidatus Hydrogenedentota bacterium]